MKELINVYQEKGEGFLDDLFNDYLIVTEKLAGSSFSFQKKDNTLQFFKGDSKKPINLIDRTLMVYYERPIQFISDIPAEILSTVPNDWRFCFQYFVNNKPTNIEYERLPHNSLVLTHIIVKDERGKTAKIIEDPRVIKDWATKFHVTPMQPIFYGKLNSNQKDKIKDFLSVPTEDQMEIFGTSSFAKYLIKGVLNPSLNSTMLHNDLLNPIDSIVFKFYGDDGQSTVSAKMIDPYTSSLMKEKEPVDLRRAPADINEIVLLDILAFLEERGLRRHDVLSATTEERYLELVSALFNDYVERRGEDLQKLDFQKAEFSKADEFGLNLDLIKNEKTKKILGQSDVLKDLFKIMLGSLRKKRNPKKEGAIMTTSVIEDFNKMIDKIQKIAQEETDGEFKTFEDYLKLKQMNEELYIGNDLEEMVKEEVYLNFKEFTNISKININEALKVPHKEQGKKKVNIFVGRFQPFTLGHAKVFKQLHDLNGLPVHVLLVRGGKPDPEKRPFDEDAQQRMFQAMQKQYPFLSGSTVIPNGSIDTIYSALRPAYEPTIWGYGTDRKKSYGGMIDKQSYRDQLGVLPDFKGHEIKRGDEDISASKVRKALKVDDRKTFERMVPKSLHDFYEELQNILVPIEENVNEKGKTLIKNKESGDEYEVINPDPEKHEIIEPTSKETKGDEEAEVGEEKIIGIPKGAGSKRLKAQLENGGPPNGFTKSQRTEAKKVLKALEDYENLTDESTPEERKAALQTLITTGGFTRNAPGVDTKTVYIGDGGKDKNGEKNYIGSGRGSRWNAKTGLKYSNTFTSDQKKGIINDAEELGVIVPLNQTTDRVGKKRLAPYNLHVDENDKPVKPESIKPKVEKETVDGKEVIKSITLGKNPGLKINRTDPLNETQKKALAKNFKKGPPERTTKEVDRLMAMNDRFRKQNNQKIEAFANGEIPILPIKNSKGESVDVFSKEGQKEATAIVSKNITKKVKGLLSTEPPVKIEGTPLGDRMNAFDNAAQAIADNTDPKKEKELREAYKKEMDQLLIEMENNPNTRAGMADIVETFAMAEDLSQGRPSVSPAASNFPVGDVITFDPGELSDDASLEEINKHIKIMTTSSGTRSIKYDGGASSQSANKIGNPGDPDANPPIPPSPGGTNFAEFKNEKGETISGEEIKKDLWKAANDDYDTIFANSTTPKQLDDAVKGGQDLAEKYEVTDVLKKRGLYPELSAERKEKYSKRAKGKSKAMAQKMNGLSDAEWGKLSKAEQTAKREEASEVLIKQWQAMDTNGYTMAAVNNKQADSQSFTNRQYKFKPANGEKTISAEKAKTSDAILKDDKGEPIPVYGEDGEPIPGKYRVKQELDVRESNGVSQLACMEYNDDPGYGSTGTPTNKMPTFVKNCPEENSFIGD